MFDHIGTANQIRGIVGEHTAYLIGISGYKSIDADIQYCRERLAGFCKNGIYVVDVHFPDSAMFGKEAQKAIACAVIKQCRSGKVFAAMPGGDIQYPGIYLYKVPAVFQ